MKITSLKKIPSMALAAMLALTATQNAMFAEAPHDRSCSNVTLRGGYGFFVGAIVLPAGTPRSNLGRMSFDGLGNWSITITTNDNGTVRHVEDSGTYMVDSDCTGKMFSKGGGVVEFVLVDGGKELYQLRTVDSSILFRFNVAKKQFPDDNGEDQVSSTRKNGL
jgi:hypothetical protein